jgi:SAM-dependent methyltransferase
VREDFYPEYFRIEDRHWWFVGRRNIFTRLLDRYVGPDPGGERRVLDVGCGTGTMLGYLERYGRPEGVDAEPAAVEFCRRRGVTTVTQAAVPPLPFEDERFGLVTAFDFVEHVDDDAGTLGEIRRVLRPGGIFMATVPAYRFLWGNQDEVAHHKRRYTAPEFRSDLEAAGFAPRRITYFNSLLFPPIAAVRLARKLVPAGGEPRSDFEMTDEEGLTNRALARIFSAEGEVLTRRDIPFGVSVLAIAAREA